MVESINRPLDVRERRILSMRLASVRTRWTRFQKRMIVVQVGLCAVMTIVTVLSGSSWTTAFVFWLVTSTVLGVWIWIENRAQHRKEVRQIESVLRAGEVLEVRIQATAVVELEEEEDEGACYAFDVGSGTILFVTGQEFYPTRNFPNTDFSIVELRGKEGVVFEPYLEKHGERLAVTRTISAKSRKSLRLPEHLQRVDASLSDVERVLAGHET